MPIRYGYNSNSIVYNNWGIDFTHAQGTAFFTSLDKPLSIDSTTTTDQQSNEFELKTGIFTLNYDFTNDFRGSGAKFIETLENEFLRKVHNKLLSCIRDTREYTVKIFNKTKYKYNKIPYPYNRLTIEIAILLLNYDDAEIGDSVRVFGVIPNASLMVDSKERVWELHSKDDVQFYTRIK